VARCKNPMRRGRFMDGREVIQQLRRELDHLQHGGQFQVNITALKGYLDALSTKADQHKVDAMEDIQIRVAGAQMQHTSWVEMARSVQESARGALNTLILVNGGAAVAILGFVGTAHGERASYMDLPLLDFGLGVLAGTIGFATRYLSGASAAKAVFRNPTNANLAASRMLDAVTVAIGVASIVLFALGIGNAYLAIH
jgi:hypothetical protein